MLNDILYVLLTKQAVYDIKNNSKRRRLRRYIESIRRRNYFFAEYVKRLIRRWKRKESYEKGSEFKYFS